MKKFSSKITRIGKGSWTIFPDLCKSCGLCLARCPHQALIFSQERNAVGRPLPKVLAEKCRLCQVCEINCPELAIRVDKKKD